MTHLLDIPVVLELSLVLKFTLLIGRPVSQFAGKHVDNFSGRGGVVIEAAGILYASCVDLGCIERRRRACIGRTSAGSPRFVLQSSGSRSPTLCAHCSVACGLVY
jgi:hypothetical protein